jgi:hypothetical protein
MVRLTLDAETTVIVEDQARCEGKSPQQIVHEIIAEHFGDDDPPPGKPGFRRIAKRKGKSEGRSDEQVDGETRIVSVPPHIARRLRRG